MFIEASKQKSDQIELKWIQRIGRPNENGDI